MAAKQVCLDDFTGKTLQDFLVNQVDSKNWNEDNTYEFYQCRNAKKRPKKTVPTFKIEPKPTSNQPGNGMVEFLNESKYRSYRHVTLSRVYRQTDFPQLRADYLRSNLGNVEEDKVLAANVLLSFEIARRVDEREKKYPLTRSEVEEAIKYVMSLEGAQYTQKVILIFDFALGDIIVRVFRKAQVLQNPWLISFVSKKSSLTIQYTIFPTLFISL